MRDYDLIALTKKEQAQNAVRIGVVDSAAACRVCGSTGRIYINGEPKCVTCGTERTAPTLFCVPSWDIRPGDRMVHMIDDGTGHEERQEPAYEVGQTVEYIASTMGRSRIVQFAIGAIIYASPGCLEWIMRDVEECPTCGKVGDHPIEALDVCPSYEAMLADLPDFCEVRS